MTPEPIFSGLSRPLDLRDIFLRIPEQALPLIDFTGELMRGPSALSPAERELIYAYGSRAGGCLFSFKSHSQCAIDLGIPRDVFQAPLDAIDQVSPSPRIGPLVRYTLALITRGEGDTASMEKGKALLPERDAWIDAVLVSGFTAYINRVLEGLGAYLPDTRHEQNGQGLARFGYENVRREVARSLEEAGHVVEDSAWPKPVASVPAELQFRRGLVTWLDSYQQLVFDSPSRVPRELRQLILQRARKHSTASSKSEATSGALHANHPRAVTFAFRLLGAPVQSTRRDIDHLIEEGWQERDVVDLVIAASTAACVARVEAGVRECLSAFNN
jgi:alkylhydroperoxidase family enzyme